MKCQQLSLGFELRFLCPFPTTITITCWVPLLIFNTLIFYYPSSFFNTHFDFLSAPSWLLWFQHLSCFITLHVDSFTTILVLSLHLSFVLVVLLLCFYYNRPGSFITLILVLLIPASWFFLHPMMVILLTSFWLFSYHNLDSFLTLFLLSCFICPSWFL